MNRVKNSILIGFLTILFVFSAVITGAWGAFGSLVPKVKAEESNVSHSYASNGLYTDYILVATGSTIEVNHGAMNFSINDYINDFNRGSNNSLANYLDFAVIKYGISSDGWVYYSISQDILADMTYNKSHHGSDKRTIEGVTNSFYNYGDMALRYTGTKVQQGNQTKIVYTLDERYVHTFYLASFVDLSKLKEKAETELLYTNTNENVWENVWRYNILDAFKKAGVIIEQNGNESNNEKVYGYIVDCGKLGRSASAKPIGTAIDNIEDVPQFQDTNTYKYEIGKTIIPNEDNSGNRIINETINFSPSNFSDENKERFKNNRKNFAAIYRYINFNPAGFHVVGDANDVSIKYYYLKDALKNHQIPTKIPQYHYDSEVDAPVYEVSQKAGYTYVGTSTDATGIPQFNRVAFNPTTGTLGLFYNNNVIVPWANPYSATLYNGTGVAKYVPNKDETIGDISYNLNGSYQAVVKSITGTNPKLTDFITFDGNKFPVSTIPANVTVDAKVKTITLPDTIKTVGANALAKDSITDVYMNNPSFDNKGVFKDGVTFHLYKGTVQGETLKTNYPNSKIEYYGIPVTFNLDGGKIEGDLPEKVYYRDTTPIPTPTKEGYQFIGWYYDKEFTKQADTNPYYKDVSDKDPKNLTYYAKWHEIIKITPEEVEEADNGDYVDEFKSEAEIEEEELLKKQAEEKAKEEAATTEETPAPNMNADNEKVAEKKNTTYKNTDTTPAPTSSGQISYKQVKGKKIQVIFKNVAVPGFEIQYSTNKNFKAKNTKTITVTFNGTTEKTIILKKLKKNKTYYVRVRAFGLNADGSRHYAEYTKAKKLIIKK